ncbi:hypothetical protein [Streptomyces avidinii]|uniref:Uncharacterized protein n=1 Tax=Streptomyces avidinii TaxID=1895 RepID=A0ABS4L6Y5_STRAV|nr:hypothetical protein [Streptomyces avidinii]MBP2037828.1 hypothetical protein [Streptomyces avidinii]GGZ08389.1 hypothetical protein GCM10010343_38290 [Streptomyces avidinii]
MVRAQAAQLDGGGPVDRVVELEDVLVEAAPGCPARRHCASQRSTASANSRALCRWESRQS